MSRDQRHADRRERHRGPCGKTRYNSEHAAMADIRSLQRHGKSRVYEGRLHPYVCKACRGWHVGHTDRYDRD